ncbi:MULTISPECIES: HAD hydrolase-like protein [unclassified Brachybacterium]|uniref:HAD hydrolase-like protein n=1 Tax=unclassified Brachybacterium TaxID=2623841 RepID=UPI003F914C0D
MLSTAPGALADVPVVLLDLDGTIVDSGPGIFAALGHAFAACDEPLPEPAVLRTFIGPPLTTSFRGVLGMSAERAEQLRLAYTEHYQSHGLLDALPYPGIPELLDGLAASGRTVAVATNKPETTARRLLEHQGLGDRFALIGGTDRASGRSDKAAVIGSVLERLGLAAGAAGRARTVMIGDRIHDAEGASEHGVPALLVGWGYGGPVEQAADVPRVATVAELSALLMG